MHTKCINTLCGQNVELVNVTLVVHIVTTGLCRVNILSIYCTRMNNTVFDKKKKLEFGRYLLLRLYSHVYSTAGSVAIPQVPTHGLQP